MIIPIVSLDSCVPDVGTEVTVVKENVFLVSNLLPHYFVNIRPRTNYTLPPCDA